MESHRLDFLVVLRIGAGFLSLVLVVWGILHFTLKIF
jgi:hypothetical protein